MGPSANVGIWCVRLDEAAPAAPVAVLQGVAGHVGILDRSGRHDRLCHVVDRKRSLVASVIGRRSARGRRGAAAARHEPQFVPALLARWTVSRLLDVAARQPLGPLAHEHADAGHRGRRDRERTPSFFRRGCRTIATLLMATGGASVRRVARVAIDTRQVEDVPGLPAQMANLALSPDGRDLAYHATNDTGGLTAWHVPASGGQPVRLSPPRAIGRLPRVVARWQPDRARSRRRRAHADLDTQSGRHGTASDHDVEPGSTGRIRGRPTTTGSRLPASAMACGMSGPSRRRLAFPQQLTRFTTPNGYVRYPAWSPLNDRIVFEHATVTANVWTGRLTGAPARAQ